MMLSTLSFALLLLLLCASHTEIKATRILMLGDSTMTRLVLQFSQMLSCTALRGTMPRCNYSSYFGLTSTRRRWPPQVGEGPNLYGLENPGCSDCGSCSSRRYKCVGNYYIEYISMEFAKDLELQTDQYETTQENIFNLYLAAKPFDVIIGNMGLHDIAVCPTAADMESSMRFLFDLIRRRYPHTKVVWLENAHVYESRTPVHRRNVTNSKRVQMLNAVTRAMSKEFDLTIMDLFNISTLPYFTKLYSDHLHLQSEFYQMVAFSLLNRVPPLVIPNFINTREYIGGRAGEKVLSREQSLQSSKPAPSGKVMV